MALNCKHVYNWSTLTSKKSNGQFALTNCARTCLRERVCVRVTKTKQENVRLILAVSRRGGLFQSEGA